MVPSILGCRFVSVTGIERKHDRQTCKILPYVLHTAHKVFGSLMLQIFPSGGPNSCAKKKT